MAKQKLFPMPSKRYVSGAWVVLWRYTLSPGNCKQYTVSTGLTNEKRMNPTRTSWRRGEQTWLLKAVYEYCRTASDTVY